MKGAEVAEGDAGKTYRTAAYQYGCPSKADLGEEAVNQLWLANALWNAQVEAERAHEAQDAEVLAACPEFAAALGEARDAGEAVAAVEAEMRQARREDGTTLPRKSDAERLKEARRRLRAAKADVKAARKAAVTPEVKAKLDASKAACRACDRSTKRPDSLYKEFAGQGLGWGTVNDVLARFRVARSKMIADRTAGRPAELRFHRFDGSGTLTVQVQRESGDPVPSPAVLASGAGKWRNQVTLGPWTALNGDAPKGTARHGSLRARVAAGLTVDVPVVLHRYLPADAEVKQVKVTRRKVAGSFRLSVSVTFRTAVPVRPATGRAVAVKTGWKAAGDGWLHAARVSAPEGLAVPPGDLAGMLRVAADGKSADLFFPASWREVLERGAAVRGYRDRLLGVALEVTAAVLKEHPEAGELLGWTAGDVARWRSAGRLARLVFRWRDLLESGELAVPLPAVPAALAADGDGLYACQPPRGRRGLAAGRGRHAHDLECWRRRDRHLWEFEAHEREQVTARRRDAYRKLAAWACEAAETVVLHDLDLASLRRVPDVGREDPERGRASRGNAQAVAPGELAAAVRLAAEARGVEVLLAGGRGGPGRSSDEAEG